MRIQICPALMDWLVFLVHFAVLYAAGERGLSIYQCAWIGGIFQIAYMGSSLALGAALSRRNARLALFTGTSCCMLFGIACLLVRSFTPLMVVMAAFGVSLAAFFNAFQTFMRGETEPGSLSRTVGRYTLAWSTGAGLGFLSAGFFYRLGVWALCVLSGLVCVVVMGILLTHRARPHDEHSADEHVEHEQADGRGVDPIYVWVAWCMIFTAMFIQRPIQTFFPVFCARAGIKPFLGGLTLCLTMFVQAVFGYRMAATRGWSYRRTPLWAMPVSTGCFMLVMWQYAHLSFAVSFVGISLVGIYTGFAYFFAVYYASNSTRGSFNIGVNECLVGLGSFAGLLISQWWIGKCGDVSGMYLVCAIALFLSAVLQVAMATFGARNKEEVSIPALHPEGR